MSGLLKQKEDYLGSNCFVSLGGLQRDRKTIGVGVLDSLVVDLTCLGHFGDGEAVA